MKIQRVFILLGVILIWASMGHADLTDGLVLNMPLDEGNGTTTQDLSDNAFVGDLAGNPQWVDGKFGKALQFVVAADLVSLADDAVFHIQDAITQAAWVKLDRLPGAHAIVFGTRSGGGRNIGFGYGMNPSNGIKVWTNDAGGGFTDINDNATALEPGTWYYLAYTHTNDNDGLVEIYVDGVVTHSEASANPVAPAGTPSEVTIGTWAGEAWPGTVDEVRLWNRVLSTEEIQESMNIGGDLRGTSVEPGGKLATAWGSLKAVK
jgi:hypothetical protein